MVLPRPFAHMRYAEAMQRVRGAFLDVGVWGVSCPLSSLMPCECCTVPLQFGSDKPDTRFGMELVDLTGTLANTSSVCGV